MRRPRLSPLRYPGGKSGLYALIREIVRINGLSRGTYVEPYAGGAGAALGLLITGEVRRIVINDLDPAVYAFWKAVTSQYAEFSKIVESCEVTVEEWQRQRKLYLTADRADILTLGFATFFLNRTNRSGVLNGGPIGGHDQSGNYKIDARFNKKTLLDRLRLIRMYTPAIDVRNRDGLDIIDEHFQDPSCLIYADPPYFLKAGSLYMNSFTDKDHVDLADRLNRCAGTANWILTYDNHGRVHELYPDRRRSEIGVHYSARSVTKARELLVSSDRLLLEPDGLWPLTNPSELSRKSR